MQEFEPNSIVSLLFYYFLNTLLVYYNSIHVYIECWECLGCLPVTFSYKKLEQFRSSTVTYDWKIERQFVVIMSITIVL